MHGKTVYWGICSAGKICQDFVCALNSLSEDEHQVKAIGASSYDRAKQFADEYSIPKVYGSYEELSRDPELDVVYIGTLTSQHYAHTKMMLEAGKAVLCEKPFCMTPAQERSLFALAKKKELFLMEAVWSRCFPLYKALRETIERGEIGEVRVVQSAFGDYFTDDPNHRIAKKELGGGALYDIGIYQIQLCQFIFREKPLEQVAVGFLNPYGVDETCGMTLKYSNKGLASMATSVVSTLPNDATICGTKGFIKIHTPFWSPTAMTVNGVRREFPLPVVKGKLNFRNSEGLVYEAKEVRRCLMEKRLESPAITHAMSIEISEIIEKARKDMGYDLPEDSETYE